MTLDPLNQRCVKWQVLVESRRVGLHATEIRHCRWACIRLAAQQRLHLTGLSCAKIEVAALAQAVLARRFSSKPARQVSQIVRRALASLAPAEWGAAAWKQGDKG